VRVQEFLEERKSKFGSALFAAAIGLAADSRLHFVPKPSERFCQILPALREAGPRYRNRYCNRASKGIEDGNSNGPDAGIMFAQIKSKVLPSRHLNLP
jgi:hypothetical protein